MLILKGYPVRQGVVREALNSVCKKPLGPALIFPTWPKGPSRSGELQGPWRGACAPRHVPDRFPVTAGIRLETATRPLDSARFSRLESQRGAPFLPPPCLPHCRPQVLRVLPLSFSLRLSSSYPLPSFLMLSSWTISSFLMRSSFSFSSPPFSLFS